MAKALTYSGRMSRREAEAQGGFRGGNLGRYHMFAIHFRRDLTDRDDFVLVAKGLATLVEARDRRMMSGDLVVDEKGRVVRDVSWLFDWERADPRCYARRAMAVG